jgi:DNA-binding response OmpR family regulator
MSAPRVLIVEDNPSTRAMIEQLLDLEGYDVVSAADGPAALQSLDPAPALVLLDVMLPGIDGFEVLKAIRENEATHDVPVVMLTALDDADSTWKGWTAGCHYYMNKPFDTDHLISVVAELTSGVAA